MARSHGKILASIWNDDDFRALTVDAQRAYMLLLSQAKLTLAGAIDYMPKRWAAYAAGTTAADIERAIDELAAARFVVLDRDTDELLVRSFVRHDIVGTLKNRNLVKGFWSAVIGVESDELLAVLVQEIPDELWDSQDYEPPPRAVQMRRSGRSKPQVQTTGSNPRSEPPSPFSLLPSPCSLPPSRSDSLEPIDTQTAALDDVSPGGDVAAVFDAWIESTGRTDRTRLDAKRRRAITQALKAYPVADVIDAVRGWQHSPHHAGQNDTRTVYNDIGLLLRDAAHIEKFRDLERGHGPAPVALNQNLTVLERLANR